MKKTLDKRAFLKLFFDPKTYSKAKKLSKFHPELEQLVLEIEKAFFAYQDDFLAHLYTETVYIERLTERIKYYKWFRYIKVVVIRNCIIENIPVDVYKIQNVERLYIQDCHSLQEISLGIGTLEKLTLLEIVNTPLKKLPKDIGGLISLKSFKLENTKVNRIPETIGTWCKLKKLMTYKNGLLSLPQSIGHLQSLEELYIDHESIVSIPDTIGQLGELKNLSFQHNYLMELPASMYQLKKLKSLILTQNEFRQLPLNSHFCNQINFVHISDKQDKEWYLSKDGYPKDEREIVNMNQKRWFRFFYNWRVRNIKAKKRRAFREKIKAIGHEQFEIVGFSLYRSDFSDEGYTTDYNFSECSQVVYTHVANDPIWNTTDVDEKFRMNDIDWLNLKTFLIEDVVPFWEDSYEDPLVFDGEVWTMNIDMVGQSIQFSGRNEYPDNFNKVIELMHLTLKKNSAIFR